MRINEDRMPRVAASIMPAQMLRIYTQQSDQKSYFPHAEEPISREFPATGATEMRLLRRQAARAESDTESDNKPPQPRLAKRKAVTVDSFGLSSSPLRGGAFWRAMLPASRELGRLPRRGLQHILVEGLDWHQALHRALVKAGIHHDDEI